MKRPGGLFLLAAGGKVCYERRVIRKVSEVTFVMMILIAALIFGVVVLLILAWNMGMTFSNGMRGSAPEKIRAIVKLLLLLEVIGFIVLFVMVILKTMML